MKINRPLSLLIVATMFSLSLQASGMASIAQQKDTTVVKKGDAKKGDKPQDKDKNKDDKKKDVKKKNEYEELMKKKGTVMKGLFTVRHIDDKWYFEVPDSLLGRYILCVTRYTAVPQGFGKFAGEEVNEATVYFEKRDYKTMLLRAYVLSQFAKEGDNISKTLQASTIDPIVASFKIIGKNKKKDMSLIEVTNMFMKDNKLMASSSDAPKSLKVGALASDRSFIDTMKVYPINIEVATTRTYGVGSGRMPAAQTGTITLGMNTSMVILPKTPMRKRLWDKRVGYFVNRFTVFDDDQHKTEHEASIARYRLEPKDKKAYLKGKLTEPVKPIIYYIDPATPKKWVPYLIQGINDWNVAFEAAGFKNAIQGREWPNDPNMSVDDARYCVLRYLPAEIENAYGPHVSDPRSGEIIESHICWYHNVMNLLTQWYMVQCGPLDKRAQTMKMDDALMGELIRFVSSHEVGHTLGLRHNMGASFATPVEKLRDKKWVEAHGHTVSIMDYARFNYVAQPEDNISEKGLFPRINDYDKWAIKWGYQWRPEFNDEFEEKDSLMTETTEILRKHPEYWFSGEGRDEDPRSQTECLGDNNMKASTYGVRNLKRVVAGLHTWTKQPNYQYDDLSAMYSATRGQFNRYINHVRKNIGGHYLNNLPGKKPVELAPATTQLEAVKWIGDNVMTPPMWLFPSTITDLVGVNAQSEIEKMQSTALNGMLSASLINKIYNDSFVPGTDRLKLDTYLNSVFNTVWKPLTAKDELTNKLRRTLENNYLERINAILNPKEQPAPSGASSAALIILNNIMASNTPSADATLYLLQHLDKIENYVKTQQATASGINKLHYQEMLEQIKLIRDRRTTVK